MFTEQHLGFFQKHGEPHHEIISSVLEVEDVPHNHLPHLLFPAVQLVQLIQDLLSVLSDHADPLLDII